MQTHRPDDRIIALALAAIAGCVDAVAFIELGGFFVSFMSGNSTRLGVGLGQHQWQTAGFAFGLVALFVGGVAVGQLIGRRFGQRRVPVLLAVLTILLAAAAALYGRGAAMYAPPLMALAMGLSNTILGRDDAPGIGISYMTGTLVRIGGALAQPAQSAPRGLMLDVLLWIAFVAGAASGASGDMARGGTVLIVPAAVALLLAIWRWMRR